MSVSSFQQAADLPPLDDGSAILSLEGESPLSDSGLSQTLNLESTLSLTLCY